MGVLEQSARLRYQDREGLEADAVSQGAGSRTCLQVLESVGEPEGAELEQACVWGCVLGVGWELGQV